MPKPALQTGAPLAKVEATESPSPTKPMPTEPTAPLPVQASAPMPSDSPQTTTAPPGPSAAQRRRYEQRQRFLQSTEFAQIATALTTRWPHLFRVTPETIRPLAIGIANDLCAQLPDYSPKLVHHTLSQWMADHRVIYWKALMLGGSRYDLDGNPKGEVTPEQQADARAKRKAWYDRREEIRKQQMETEQDTSAVSRQERSD